MVLVDVRLVREGYHVVAVHQKVPLLGSLRVLELRRPIELDDEFPNPLVAHLGVRERWLLLRVLVRELEVMYEQIAK